MNRFVIKEKLGEGGMATVYKAHDKELRIDIALKVLHDRHAQDPEFITRFKREAQAAVRLNHPNITRVYNVGEDDHKHYIAMEFVEGPTLEDVLKEHQGSGPPFPLNQAMNILRDILSGLDHAHQNNVVHRDIKPSNIMLPPGKPAKIADFGIAKMLDRDDTLHTKEHTILGTSIYMSPEQTQNAKITGKSDVFSLGIVAYQMCTGILPFGNHQETSLTTRIRNINEGPLVSAKEIATTIDNNIDDMLLKALERDASRRYDSNSMLQDVETFLRKGEVDVTGKYSRRWRMMSRREKTTRAFASSVALAAFIIAPTFLIKNQVDYSRSLRSTADKIAEAPIGTPQWYNAVNELNNRIHDRFYWIFENELEARILSFSSEKEPKIYPLVPKVERPDIYPFGTGKRKGNEGRFNYVTGEGTTAGFIIPMAHYAAEHFKSRYEETKDPKDLQKSEKLQGAFKTYVQGLYFADNDPDYLVMDRFYYPVSILLKEEVDSSLSVLAPKAIKEYAAAIRMIFEHKYVVSGGFIIGRGRNTSQVNRPDTSGDLRSSKTLCDGFRLLDLKIHGLPSPQSYIDMIISDGNAKIRQYENDLAGQRLMINQSSTSLLLGLVTRTQLLDDIILDRGRMVTHNSRDFTPDYKKKLRLKADEYRKQISRITEQIIDQGMLVKYSALSDAPIDNIATLRLLEAVENRDLKAQIITELSKGGYMNLMNTSPTVENPLGLVKGTMFNTSDMQGMTYIETDYLLLKNLKEMVKK